MEGARRGTVAHGPARDPSTVNLGETPPASFAGGVLAHSMRGDPEVPDGYRFGWYFRTSLFRTGTTTTPSAEVMAKSFTTTQASSEVPPAGIGWVKSPFP